MIVGILLELKMFIKKAFFFKDLIKPRFTFLLTYAVIQCASISGVVLQLCASVTYTYQQFSMLKTVAMIC